MPAILHPSLPHTGAANKAAHSKRQKNVLGLFDLRMKGLKTAQARVLAIWALLNLVVGLFAIFSISDQFFYLHFHAMNASWGLVNLGVAAFIYLHQNSVFDRPQTVLQQMEHQRHAEKMMVLNMGLDLAFIAGGLVLYCYGQQSALAYPGLWEGFGVSVMMQGTFLFLLDVTFHLLHVSNRHKVYPVWKELLEQLRLPD